MTEREVLDQLKQMQRIQNLSFVCLGGMLSLLIGAFALIIIMILPLREEMRERSQSEPVNQNTNQNTLSVTGADQLLEERAERQGYYTREQFAELMGFSVRTLDRRIAENQIQPAPITTAAGRVLIPLNARLITVETASSQ